MLIRQLRLHIETQEGPYGFEFPFSRQLTIIRGGNSSGKSTLVSTLLYSMGMEELVGGRNEKALPYAVKNYLNDRDLEISITHSETWVELENSKGEVVTLRRAIRDARRDPRLIEVYPGAHLTNPQMLPEPIPTFVHDAYSAQIKQGFFRYFEEFLGLALPRVASNTAVDAKLYLQTVFAAHAVEQKRGWTDYIANIPYFGIREARTRVTEYILGLDVFDTIAERNQLNGESVAISNEWQNLLGELRQETVPAGIAVSGVPQSPTAKFSVNDASLSKTADGAPYSLSVYVDQLRLELNRLQASQGDSNKISDESLLQQLQQSEDRAAHLAELYEKAATNLSLDRLSLSELENLLEETETSLRDNRTTLKLREMGAQAGLQVSQGLCPTCDQPIADSLLPTALAGPQMDIETNIEHLGAQRRMLSRHIEGHQETIRHAEAAVADVAQQLTQEREFATATRVDLGTTAIHSKAVVRRIVNTEMEIERIERHQRAAENLLGRLERLAERLETNRLARQALPKDQYSQADHHRISYFAKLFRAYAGSFGYESVANIADIDISTDNLLPVLSQLELREIQRPKSDLNKESSASDFVRLIWSYLLSLYEASARQDAPGHHLGVLVLDEPGQHSMRDTSQHELFLRLGSLEGLQSIVAASFDESEAVFRAATDNVRYTLIEWEGKLIRPIRAPSAA